MVTQPIVSTVPTFEQRLAERIGKSLTTELANQYTGLLNKTAESNTLLAKLIETIKASSRQLELTDTQVESIAQRLEVALAQPAVHPELPPYNVRKFLLDTARAEPGDEIQVPGKTITAYTDGELEDCFVRISSPVNDAISLNEFNPIIYPMVFERFWLETTAQSGRYLRLYIGREEVTLGDTVKVGQKVRESFIHRIVSGNLTDGGTQWSSTVVTVAADTDYTLGLGTYEPKRSGKIDGRSTGGVIEFSIVVGLDASASTPNAKVTLQARNKGGTWVSIMPISAAIATSTTELEKVFAGYFPTVANFNAVPYDLQLLVQSDSASNTVTARVKNSSYVRGEFEPGA